MAPYEQDRNVGPSPEQVAEDEELAALEAEVTRVKQQRERLEQLQALEAREEQLKRSILERKKGGGSKP
jgi:capsule polysaccharide export protein KpsE/RkpR